MLDSLFGKKNMFGKTNRVSKGFDKEDDFTKKVTKGKRLIKKKAKLTLDEKMFQAGLFSVKSQSDYKRLQYILPIVCPIILIVLTLSTGDIMLIGLAGILGGLGGMQLPITILDRKIAARHEEIMYYLPLVIEQIAIGVSSSLDTGPCMQMIVTMSDERDSHNPVTELLKVVQHYTRQGVSMDESLQEIGKKTGHTELKHTFMSLAQVSRHGGEISKQLQELANAVAAQREAYLEEAIKKLELKATPPVALVFMAFFLLLMFMFGSQLMAGLNSM